MRALPLAILAIAVPALADPPTLAITARHAAVPAGSDHGSWNGIELAVERSPLARTSLRLDLAFDAVSMSSDEATFAYDGFQLSALAGVRIDVTRPTADQGVRAYYAAGIGGGILRTPSTSGRFYVEPVRLGVDIRIATATALRFDLAVLVHPTEYDPLALILAGGIAFRL